MNFAGPFDAELSHVSPVSLGGDGFTFNKPTFVQHHPSDSHVVIPDAHLLFSGDYTRIGSDLIISGDGQKVVVGNYFKGETRPALTSKDGATLAGHIVDALTGHIHYAQANAAAPAAGQVIGNVLKLSGSATAIRNGVSIELHIGDAIQKGDVIQTGSDSSIGMTFVDGSAFGMTSNARMVLNEMIYDPNGSSNSSLMSLVQGTITFVAGQTAKNGNMRVDTPVATMGIRGTAVLVEIGANDGPTKFSVLVEPDGHTGSYNLYDKATGDLIGTVSQAGQVTYVSSLGLGQPPSAIEQLKTLQDQQNEKAIIQQVFQLYFPNYNPDNSNPKSPKFGSNTSGNNLAEIVFTTNSNQQKIFLTQIELRFAVTDPVTGAVTYQNRIFYNAKAFFSADSVFANQSFVPTTESFKFEDVVKIVDPDINTDPFRDIPIPFVPGSAIIKSAVSTIPQMSEAFLKSLLSIDQNTGIVSFDRQQFNFLDDDQTVTFKIQVTATSGPDTGIVEIPVTITGANDAPTIVIGDALHPSVIAGAVTEDMPSGASSLFANGIITFQDFDLTDAHTATVALTSTASNLPGFVSGAGSNSATTRLGTFTIDPVSEDLTNTDNHGSVGWHFTLADNDPTLQSLAKDQTITQTYTITIKDNNGVPVTQTVTITITGTNDAPELTADTAASHLAEEKINTTDSSVEDAVNGSLSFTDVDLSDTHSATAALHPGTTSVVWSGGSYSGIPSATLAALGTAMKTTVTDSTGTGAGSVGWEFKLPDYLFDFLARGETLKLIYDVTVTDNNGVSSTQQVVVQVGASNDKPVISVIDADATVQEDANVQPGNLLTDTGPVTFTDTDISDTHTAHVAFNGAVGGNGGSVSTGLLTALGTALSVPASALAAGVYTFNWNFALSNGFVQYLGAGETVTATYTITVKDGSGDSTTDTSVGQTVTVVITGTNDTPVIGTATLTGTVTEDTTPPAQTGSETVTGTIAFSDVDLTDTHTVSAAFKSTDYSSQLGSLTAVRTNDTSGGVGGLITWTFTASDAATNQLAAGQFVHETYTVTLNDGKGGVVTRDVVVTIAGANDDAIITVSAGDSDIGAVTEDTHSATETATGTLSFSDVDLTDTHTITAAPVGTTLGTLTATKIADTANGTGGSLEWTYSVANSAIQHLAAGQQVDEKFTISIFDGTSTVTKEVTVTVAGANDDAIITVSAGDSDIGAVTEDTHSATETATGTLSFSDVDLTDTHTITAAPVGTTLGTLTATKIADTANGTGGSLEWTYSVANSAIQHLAAGQQVDEKFTISIFDGTSTVTKEVTVTVAGANDDAIITVSAGDSDIGAVTEDTHSATETATGTLSFSDVDLTDTHTITAAPVGTTLGTLTATKIADTANGTGGSLEWTYSVANSAIHYLADGETKTETFKVSIFDGTSTVTKDVLVTIHGTNDVPIIAGVAVGDVTEDTSVDSGYLKTDGTLTITDADHDQSAFVAQTSTAGIHGYGTFTLNANGHWTYAADNSQTAIQQLGASDTLTDSFIAHSLDGSADQLVTVTIHGTNDAPVINIDNVTPVELDGNGVMQVSGVTVSDIDAGSDIFTVTAVAANGTVATNDGHSLDPLVSGGGFTGTFAQITSLFTDGAVYTPNYAGLTDTDTVTLTVTDGHSGSDTVNFIFKQYAAGGVTLNGTGGNDWILSSTGNDTMTGAAGHDNFVFAPSSGQDTVMDFTHGDDKIDLHLLTGGPTTATIATWLASSAVETVGSDTLLHLNGNTDTVLLKGVTSLSASDFILHA